MSWDNFVKTCGRVDFVVEGTSQLVKTSERCSFRHISDTNPHDSTQLKKIFKLNYLLE